MKALAVGALRHDIAVVRPQAGGLAMGARALAALPQKPTPAPDASERQPYNGGIIGGLPREEPLSTPREQELDTQIRTNLADKPDALAAYEDLLETDAFTRTSVGHGAADSRVALLEQVQNYPEADVIRDLGRLGEREWFREQSFEDKQRSAKMVAFNVSDTTPGDNQTRRNTIDRILSSDDVDVGWTSIDAPKGSVTYGQAGEKGLLWWRKPYIELNSDLVPAGPDKIDPSDGDAVHVVSNTLAHEINHTITPGGNEQSYGYFMDEYRAWYVGYQAENGHPPSARDAYDRASYLTASETGSYGNIGKAFRDEGSEDQKQIVAFMAQLMGLDPATASFEDVNDFHNFNNRGPAPAPVPAFSDDPNNLDNG
ncbi:MAG: hypothetical protein Q4G24_09820 [Paracoccus sp. (in: a-proteobacteria)]|uniref:hypothetical protein n=1 Tax=Paracoccus sp. TaxID=267 RepID=UPI0026E0DD97|nr:hypothetical protein [Paracoccus sp. (in: a-proteobacteria)]MDO5621754.1 hypothetical protein [Paracoccus sp. (in: a-proteobacteria)]